MLRPIGFELSLDFDPAPLYAKLDPPLPLAKCCGPGHFLSSTRGHCVPTAAGSCSSGPPANWSARFADVSYGMPCDNQSSAAYENVRFQAQLDRLLPNGSLAAVLGFSGPTLFEARRYCFELEAEFRAPVLVVCKPTDNLRLATHHPYLLAAFWVSVALAVATLAVHAALPELRRRVHDKCFICYLAFLVSSLLLLYSYFFVFENESATVSLAIITGCAYTTLSTFCWLNAMCIHLWRTVTAIFPIPERSFYIYTLYALALPLICVGAYSLDYAIFQTSFICRGRDNHFYSNPEYLYGINVLAVLQVINLIIFIRVGYIIWYLKRESMETDSNRHMARQKTMFSQLFRLFVMMGLDWINIFFLAYFSKSNSIFLNIFFLFNVCPGYLIFIMFVLCKKNVISILKRRLGLQPTLTSSNTYKSIISLNRNQQFDCNLPLSQL